eukprot:CAMPEP_0184855640 /NCGR_PEP_ID=MMETSP0580-20130426/819_1 /TAXON_ID=1118495 /ORGANISM="Dactyliosolen fragilissimus" /LENGTH=154 /DNA_ID=CAMNT_0027350203 /DNA_START=72 /DNA_END=536 /DNA_ORIENTATION=+
MSLLAERTITILSLCFLFASVSGWGVNSSNDVGKLLKSVASGTAASIIATGVAFGNANAFDFTGSYSDPKHPNCPRLIAIEGSEAIITGADGNPGCIGGEGRPWKLIGRVSGDEIFVDFAPKGGPKDLKGTYEGGKKDGIRWPDGNKWSLEAKP